MLGVSHFAKNLLNIRFLCMCVWVCVFMIVWVSVSLRISVWCVVSGVSAL